MNQLSQNGFESGTPLRSPNVRAGSLFRLSQSYAILPSADDELENFDADANDISVYLPVVQSVYEYLNVDADSESEDTNAGSEESGVSLGLDDLPSMVQSIVAPSFSRVGRDEPASDSVLVQQSTTYLDTDSGLEEVAGYPALLPTLSTFETSRSDESSRSFDRREVQRPPAHVPWTMLGYSLEEAARLYDEADSQAQQLQREAVAEVLWRFLGFLEAISSRLTEEAWCAAMVEREENGWAEWDEWGAWEEWQAICRYLTWLWQRIKLRETEPLWYAQWRDGRIRDRVNLKARMLGRGFTCDVSVKEVELRDT